MINEQPNKIWNYNCGTDGVGGSVSGLLASKYHNENHVEIIFIARGENEIRIRENGLKLITVDDERIVFPDLISQNPETINTV